VEEELGAVVAALRENPRLRAVMEDARLPVERRRAVLAEVLPDRLGGLTRAFVSLVLAKGRARYLEAIFDEFRRLADEARRQVEVEIRTARPLGEDELNELAAGFRAATGREVRLSVWVEPELLGGLVARLGDRVWDGSVTGRLRRLRERLTGAVRVGQD